jgi:parvulin-like peptidyl-prolyl isomerase
VKTHSLPLRFSFFLVFLAFQAQAKTLDRVMAVVGTEPILQSEVEDRLSLIQRSPVYSNILGLNPKSVDQGSVLEMMIEEKILAAVTDEMKATVADVDVQKQVDSIAKSNNITRKQLEASLKSEGIPFEAYANNIRMQLQKRTIFDRELRAAGGVGENELRNLYQKRAMREFELILLEAPKAQQASTLKSFKEGSSSWSELSKKFPTTELGWVQPSSLKASLAKAVVSAKGGQLIGPHQVGKVSALIYVAAERVGSDEEFEKVKDQLSGELQAQNFGSRFASWLEAKKKEMHIVVNK